MTRTQAWRKVAEAYNTPIVNRTQRQIHLTLSGLCRALWLLGQSRTELQDFGHQMGLYGWWWLDDDERATFAALMAAMTQRERDQLVKGL